MAAYSRADFGPNPHVGANRNNAQARGWGPGWPNAQSSKMATVRAGGVAVQVRDEVAELVETLFDLTEALGYDIKPGTVAGGGTWGFANRAIRGTRTPSNHSWGLAVDVNSSVNPMANPFKTNIPPDVVKAWEICGWYWGGRYTKTPDTMHFEYLGRPDDVAGDLARARALLAKVTGAPTETPRPSDPNAKPGKRVLATGDRGSDVALIQRFLGIKDDGIFGRKTEQAVKRYQAMRELTADGVIGPKTWAPILRALGLK